MHTISRFVVLFLFLSGVSAHAADLQTDACRGGNHATAPEEWRPLQGLAEAQVDLGMMCDEGTGVPEDDRKAVRWFRLAAEQGNALAQNNLGWMYYEGTGVPEDDVLAHMWWNLSASMGNDDAAKRRNRVAGKMTPAQLQEAQKLARECVKRNYKGC